MQKCIFAQAIAEGTAFDAKIYFGNAYILFYKMFSISIKKN